MSRLVERLMQLHVPLLRTKSSPMAPHFDDIEGSLRTGDILLYSDGDWLACHTTPAERARHHWAACLMSWLGCLPCTAFATVFFDGSTVFEDTAAAGGSIHSGMYNDERSEHRAVLPGSWLDWQHALPIICLNSRDEHSPRQVPCVFMKRPNGTYAFRPARRFLEKLAKGRRVYFALRQLHIGSESTGSAEQHLANREMASNRRCFIREKIVAFLQSIASPPPAGDINTVVQNLSSVLFGLDDELFFEEDISVLQQGLDAAYVESDGGGGARRSLSIKREDVVAFARASPGYMTLCALYNAQIIRIAPRFIDAMQVLQLSAGVLSQQLSADYSYEDELVCFMLSDHPEPATPPLRRSLHSNEQSVPSADSARLASLNE